MGLRLRNYKATFQRQMILGLLCALDSTRNCQE
jgi:hypothetical protein